MPTTYAVYWSEPEGQRWAGRLELAPGYAQFSGGAGHGTRRLFRIFFDEISSVQYQRGRLRIQRGDRPTLELGSVDGPGALHELAQRLQAALLPA